MQKRIMLFTYAFVTGVALGFAFRPPFPWVWPLYIVAVLFGAAGWGLAIAQDQGRVSVRKWMVMACLFVSAVPLGAGRYAERSHIPPFDPEIPEGNHIQAFFEAYPDTDFNTTTRIIGKIVSEPEYRPKAGTPGVVALTIQPLEIEPVPGSGDIYPVSGGNVMVYLRPLQPFRQFEQDWKTAFEKLVDNEAYGWVIEVDAPFSTFRGADNPGLFDPEVFANDQDVYAQANIYFWNKNAPAIKIIDEEEKGAFYLEFALNLKKGMLGVIKQTVPFPESAFLAGVTLGARRGLEGVRCKFEEAPATTGSGWSAEDGELTDEPDLRQYVLDEFRWSGTSHVLAVSGLHVTIITGALWGLFVLMKIPKKVYAPLICLGLATFCLITGAAPSSMRAALMNSIVILTYVYIGAAFKASLMLAIGIAGFIILMNNPKWIVEPAFTLSFMAVISLGLLTKPFEDLALKIIPPLKKLPVWLQQFIYAQGSIQFGMMGPLSAYYFCRMSLAGPLANFFAIPMIGIIVQLGIFACLLGLIPFVGIYIALVLNAANYVLIWFFLWVAHASTVIFPFPFVQTLTPRMMGAYYALLCLFVWNKPLLRRAKILYYDLVMGIGGARRRTQALAVFGTTFVLVSATAIYGFWPRTPAGELRFNVLSVRYGQAIHIETPSGAQILVDAGSNDYKSGWDMGVRTVAQYLLKQRIGALDAVIMTSVAPEEMGGLAGVLGIMPTRRFYAPVACWDWDPEDVDAFPRQVAEGLGTSEAESERNPDHDAALFLFAELCKALREPWDMGRHLSALLTSPLSIFSVNGPPEAIQASSGMVLWKETGPGGDFEIVALHPNPEFPLKPVNNNSLVLKITYGERSFLIAGDVTEDGIRELLRLPASTLASDVLVLPAHGSPKSDVEFFQKTVLPDDGARRFAILSFGRSSEFKPARRSKETYRDSFLSHRQLFVKEMQAAADETARKLRERGVVVARTDELGAVLCASDGRDLRIRTMLGGDLAGEGGPADPGAEAGY